MNIKKIATALGAGTLGGVLGTAAITAAMLLETRVTGPDQTEEMTQAPAQAVETRRAWTSTTKSAFRLIFTGLTVRAGARYAARWRCAVCADGKRLCCISRP